jgi:hypothetical protein
MQITLSTRDLELAINDYVDQLVNPNYAGSVEVMFPDQLPTILINSNPKGMVDENVEDVKAPPKASKAKATPKVKSKPKAAKPATKIELPADDEVDVPNADDVDENAPMPKQDEDAAETTDTTTEAETDAIAAEMEGKVDPDKEKQAPGKGMFSGKKAGGMFGQTTK